MRLARVHPLIGLAFAVWGCRDERLVASELYTIPTGVHTRWASPENPTGSRGSGGRLNAGRKGRPSVPVRAGDKVTLAEVRGSSGVVRRIWATISDRSPAMLRGLKIEMFWDGAAQPAVNAPFGDFFGVALGRMAVLHSALLTSPEGRSFNSYIPMPFRKGMKIVVTNESGRDLPMLYYDVDYTVGDKHGDDVLYLHAHFNRENPTTLQRDYQILPKVRGRGRYLGASIGIQADTRSYLTTWWGEGEVKIYLDGDGAEPTLAGTGTEDYVGTGWKLGSFSHLYQGAVLADQAGMRFGFYRFHVPDPVYFQTDIRVTIQQIGIVFPNESGRALFGRGVPIYQAGPGLSELSEPAKAPLLFERRDDWSSCAFIYLDTPVNSLPPLMSAAQRMAGLDWDGPRLGGFRQP